MFKSSHATNRLKFYSKKYELALMVCCCLDFAFRFGFKKNYLRTGVTIQSPGGARKTEEHFMNRC